MNGPAAIDAALTIARAWPAWSIAVVTFWLIWSWRGH